MFIKAIIQAVATYGGKLFGISATQFKPIQQVVDAATQTLAKCGKSAAMVRLRQELSLTDLNIKTAVARTRAFGKWASLRTWISDLIKCPYKHRCDTWVSGCTGWTKKYNGNINKIKNTIETLNNRQKKNDKSQISKWITGTEAGTSCNWMGLELAVKLEKKSYIISTPNAKSTSTPVIVDEIENIFLPYSAIVDFNAFKNKKTSLFHTLGTKLFFKRGIKEFKIFEFMDIKDKR
ncbi:hypothetical protein BB561_000479 [Smittium simulii]|uniref:Uncharacterized protein n=1 Tax=Smittium simulii TaxID=133385 RepID=A0A2T9YYX1_9FUNG|nr:hypothetical protein BB561_000479 [Smittium simulii]